MKPALTSPSLGPFRAVRLESNPSLRDGSLSSTQSSFTRAASVEYTDISSERNTLTFLLGANKFCRSSLEVSGPHPLEMSVSRNGLGDDARTRSATDRSESQSAAQRRACLALRHWCRRRWSLRPRRRDSSRRAPRVWHRFSNLLFLGANALLPWLPIGARQRFAPMGRDSGLSAPLVYGATLETTRRFLRLFL
jgi:hypothetical protein